MYEHMAANGFCTGFEYGEVDTRVLVIQTGKIKKGRSKPAAKVIDCGGS